MPNKKRYANRKRKHSQTGNHNDSPIDDGTNITTKEQTICETCLKQFSSLPMHFASNPFCAQSINDLSIVGKVTKKTDKITQVPNISKNSKITLNTFDGMQIHDPSAGLMEICSPVDENLDEDGVYKDDVDEELIDNTFNYVEEETGTNYEVHHNMSNISIGDHDDNNIETHFINQGTTKTLFQSILDNSSIKEHQDRISFLYEQDDSSESAADQSSSDDIVVEDNNNEANLVNDLNQNFVVPRQEHENQCNLPFDYDLRYIQLILLQQMVHLLVDEPTTSCIQLMKIMQVGKIPNCHYTTLIKWFNWTMMTLSTDSSNTTSSTRSSSYSAAPLSRQPNIPQSRKKVIDSLNDLFSNKSHDYSLAPIHEVIQLPSSVYAKISCFKFSAIVTSLLSEPEFMSDPMNNYFQNEYYRDPTRLNNIPINKKQYRDLHHGSAFLSAYKKCCKDKRDILLPIIAFIDGTPIDAFGRLKLEVVMISLGIATQSFRNKSDAWRILGYIPSDFSEEEEQDKPISTKHSLTHRQEATKNRMDYHQILQFIFRDIISLEKSDKGILWDIHKESRDGEITIETVRLKPFLILIVGDAVGNDKLADRYISYGKSVKRLCRDCDCPTEHLDDPDYVCSFTKRNDIIDMSDNDLKKISYYKISNNAFDNLHFGGDEHGINGNSPPEPLHQNNIGCQKKLNIFFSDCLTKPGKKFFNAIVKHLCANWCRQSARNYFQINLFKDGFERPQLTGDEVITQTFVLYLALVQTHTLNNLPNIESSIKKRYKTKKTKVKSNKGGLSDDHNDVDDVGMINDEEAFYNHDDDDEDITIAQVNIKKMYYPKISDSINQMKKWIMLFEMCLCLDAWLTQPSIKHCDVSQPNNGINNNTPTMSKADIALRQYLQLYCSLLQEPIGNGTKTAKIHWLLHIPHYIRKFGPPNVISTQRPESNLSPMVKTAGRATQMRPAELTAQATNRYYESLMINRSFKLLQSSPLSGGLMRMKELDDDLNTNKNAIDWNNDHMLYIITGKYKLDLDDNYEFNKVIWPKGREKHISHNKKLLTQIIHRLKRKDFQLNSKFINCFTRLDIVEKGNKESRNMFRADPYFFKKIWMDWCIARWTTNNETTSDREDDDNFADHYDQQNHGDEMNLCRILMFIDTTEMKFGTTNNDIPKLLAVIRCTKEDKRKQYQRLHKDCRLITSYEMEEMIRIIPCNTISKTAYVVTDLVNIQKQRGGSISFASRYVLLVRDKSEWPNMFIDNKWK